MKHRQIRKKCVSILLTLVMLLSIFPVNLTASAEEHTHGEGCYCPGGELVCTLEESEGHTHGEDCFCPGGELICTLSEAEPFLTAAGEVTTSAEFVAAVQAGGEVKLGADITVDLATQPTITVDKAVTIDCNGHTLTITGGTIQSPMFKVVETGDLTLVNAKIKQEKGLTIKSNAGKVTVKSTQGAGIEVNTFIATNDYSGTLTVVDGTISAKTVIVGESRGDIDIHGGTFSSNGSCFYNIHNQGNDKSFKVCNATITAGEYGNCVYFDNAYNKNNEISNTILNSTNGDCVSLNYGSVALRGVTATSNNNRCVYVYAGSVEIFGGNYTAKDDCVYADDNVYVSGSTVTLHVGATFTATADTGNGCLTTASHGKYVFADKTYTVTLIDNGTTKTETVLVNTPLGKVPGLDRTDNGDSFYGWLLDGEIVNAATTTPVQSALTLTAAYANTTVTNYAELQAAVTAKKPVIVLNDDIDDFAGKVTINYPCFIEGNGHGLVRPNGFTDVLLESVGADASVTINNALADGRNLDAQAPALAAQSGGALILNHVTVQNNKNTVGSASSYSSEQGGGIYVDEGSLRMTDCVVRNNYSDAQGGGIYVEDAVSTVVLTNCTIEENRNECCGGGIYIEDSPAVLTNCQILNNSTTTGHRGGGMYVNNYDGPSATITGRIIQGNRSNEYGGGLELEGGAITVTDCLVAENTADDDGGGVYADDGDLHFVNCIIRDNRAKEEGGGIYVDDPTTLENCIIRDNHAVEAGGGVYAYSECTLIGGMLFDNTSDEAGDDLCQDSDEARSIYSTQGTRLNGDGNSTALGTVLTAPIPGYYPAAPGTVNIPWYGWFVDGEEDAAGDIVNRYTNRNTGKLVSATNGNLDILTGDTEDVGIKAIWYGLLLAYDANYPGTTERRYDAQGYVSGADATVADNMFARAGYRFVGWNTKADGSGTAYAKGAALTMDKSQVLYAQWERLPLGSLTVSNTVTGNRGDTNKAFTFTVKLGDTGVSGVYGDMTFTAGVATFQLKHSESKTATGLPAGVSYEVSENEANLSGYVTTSTEVSGSIVKDKAAVAAFTNTRSGSSHTTDTGTGTGTPGSNAPGKAPTTSDSSNLTLWFSLAAASLPGMAVYFAGVKKTRYFGKRMK